MTNWYIKPNLSGVTISKFNKIKAQDFINLLCEKNLSAGTIDGVKRTLNKVMEYAVIEHYIGVNPLKKVDMPDIETEDNEDKTLFIEEDDLQYIIEKLGEYKIDKNGKNTGKLKYRDLRDILLTCIFTGMRISEVLGLRVGDIDLKNNIVRVRKQSSRYKTRNGKGEVIEAHNDISRLKTKDSVRDLPIPAVWREILEERFKTLKEYNNPDLLKKDAFVFGTRKYGNMRTYSGTRSIYMRFMEDIGMKRKGYTLHDFRHSFISHSRAEGIEKETVSRYVGHANSTITERIYNHLTEREKKDVASSVDRVANRLMGKSTAPKDCNQGFQRGPESA